MGHRERGDRMKKSRREFIKAGAIGAAVAGGSSCASLGGTQLLEGPAMGEGEVDGFLATLERGMQQINGASFAGKLVPDLWSDPAELQKGNRKQADHLARQALRALLFTGLVQDLKPADQQHPKVQQKVQEQLPELDEAVLGMNNLLGSLTPQHHAELRRKLRSEPELGLRIAEELDAPAKAAGVPLDTRLKTRAMISHLTWRMRVHDPGVVFDEYRDKVTRIGTSSGQAEQIKRVMATKMSADAFWRHEDRMAKLYAQNTAVDEPGVGGVAPPPASAPASRSVPPAAPRPPAPPAPPPPGAPGGVSCSPTCTDQHPRLCVPISKTGQCVECVTDDHCKANPKSSGSSCQSALCVCAENETEDCRDPETGKNRHGPEVRRQKGNRVMKVGGWIAGSGAVVLGIGGIIVATVQGEAIIPGLIMMTVGSLALLGGLITLLVGAILRWTA
jgi:hypothetical protein